MVGANCWYRWEILRFVSDSFFFFFLISFLCYLFVEAARELRMEGKRQGYLLTQILF